MGASIITWRLDHRFNDGLRGRIACFGTRCVYQYAHFGARFRDDAKKVDKINLMIFQQGLTGVRVIRAFDRD